jgi:putative addiction module CopG family antidote
MEIELTAEQNDFIRAGIEQGRYHDSADAIHRAMDQWVERERDLLELIAAIDAGDDSPESDDIVLESDEDIARFVKGVEQRGRERLAAR